MGSICAGQGVISILDHQKSRSSMSHKLEMDLERFADTPLHRQEMGSPVFFDTRDSFYSEYKLHANPIGYGEHGEVWLCNKKQGNKLRAVKMINKSSLPSLVIEDQMIHKEIEKLKRIKSNSYIKFYKVYEKRNGYYVVMEYVQGGDLSDIFESRKKFSEPEAAKILFQVILAVTRLHQNQVKFNHIKPENILFSNPENLTVKFNPLNMLSIVRDPPNDLSCFSPEALLGKLSEKSDVWSIGVIMFYLVTGILPSKDSVFLYEKVPSKMLAFLSQKGKNLMDGLLMKDPNARISLKDALNHGWILAYNHIEDLEIVG